MRFMEMDNKTRGMARKRGIGSLKLYLNFVPMGFGVYHTVLYILPYSYLLATYLKDKI